MADWMDAVRTADVAMDSRRAVEQLKAQSRKEVNYAYAEDACSLHIPRSDLGEQFMEGNMQMLMALDGPAGGSCESRRTRARRAMLERTPRGRAGRVAVTQQAKQELCVALTW